MLLADQLRQIRSNLIQNENQLAELHANIYKRREEARKIRLSMPTPEYLDNVALTDPIANKLQQKKNKTLCSIYKLQQHTQKDIEKYTTAQQQWSIPSYLKIAVLIVLVISIAWYTATHVRGLLVDPPTACH